VVADFHEAFWRIDRFEADACVNAMRIPRTEHPALEALQLRLRKEQPDHRAGEALALVLAEHEYVADISVRRAICDEARKPDKCARFIARDDAK